MDLGTNCGQPPPPASQPASTVSKSSYVRTEQIIYVQYVVQYVQLYMYVCMYVTKSCQGLTRA